MGIRCIVTLSRFVEKQLRKLPLSIKEALNIWRESVEETGIWEVRKLPGYHDEPLKGNRVGQRSVRLSRSWRVIYEEKENGKVLIIEVKEVTHHEY